MNVRKGKEISPPDRHAYLGDDRHAYCVLEEARLRLLAAPSAGSGYRHLGLAGFHASAGIPSHERQPLLHAARTRSGLPVDDEHRTIQMLVADAAATLQNALIAPGLTDHLLHALDHLSQFHSERARETVR